MHTPDVVVLVPGFLGFARLGGFYYFADRLVAVLRGLLEEALGYPVPVVPCRPLPTHALHERQNDLMAYLYRFATEKVHGAERIHLVGHSTGGVDAQLLTCTKRVDGSDWSEEVNVVRRKVASVVTISAPHYGTGLADSWLAYLGENRLVPRISVVPEAIKLAYHLLWLLPREAPAVARLQLAHPRDVIAFLAQVAFHRELIADLRPSHMEQVRKELTPEKGIALSCFVTAVEPRVGGGRTSDAFFTDMYGLTKGEEATATAKPIAACRRLLTWVIKTQPGLVIRSDKGEVPTSIAPSLNDGVVNTVRQLVNPDDPTEVAGFVIADHADVLGHYDRQDALIEGPPYNAGLFHSGAGFGDTEFFMLYRRVAQAILKTIPVAHREEASALDVSSIQPA
jgi:pimeloyl-ACP methyl ester carboxylesterase